MSLGLACPYSPVYHQIIDHDVIQWAKRECSDRTLRDQLFLYRHSQYHTFVIALWESDSHKAFVDVLNMGTAPILTRENADSLRHNLFAPIRQADIARQSAEAYRDQLHEQQDEGDEETDRIMRNYNGRVRVAV